MIRDEDLKSCVDYSEGQKLTDEGRVAQNMYDDIYLRNEDR